MGEQMTEGERVEMSEMKGKLVLEPKAIEYLEQYKIPYPNHGLAQSAENAVEIANRIGYPVVLKIVSPAVIHKSDAGGVAVDLENADEVKYSFQDIVDRIKQATDGATIEGVLVCQQASDGLEAIVGALEDPVFGATIMFGLGGVFAEVLKDVAFRIAPLERIDAQEMVSEIKGYPVLIGARGQPACDVDQLIDLLMAVSRLVTENPNIKELDLNPVRLYERGLMVLDVRVIEKGA